MAARNPTPRKQPLYPRTHTLSREAAQVLQQLGQEATDALGWTVGSSAVIRALLRYVAQQPPGWTAANLHPLIAHEIDAGTFWGSKKK
jgi:hypothetical protein